MLFRERFLQAKNLCASLTRPEFFFRKVTHMDRFMYYVLDEDNNVRGTNDVAEWGRFFEDKRRILKQEQVGPYWVSTVFLGIPHLSLREAPQIFESMAFEADGRARNEVDCERYSTYAEAIAGHERMVQAMRGRVASN